MHRTYCNGPKGLDEAVAVIKAYKLVLMMVVHWVLLKFYSYWPSWSIWGFILCFIAFTSSKVACAWIFFRKAQTLSFKITSRYHIWYSNSLQCIHIPGVPEWQNEILCSKLVSMIKDHPLGLEGAYYMFLWDLHQ